MFCLPLYRRDQAGGEVTGCIGRWFVLAPVARPGGSDELSFKATCFVLTSRKSMWRWPRFFDYYFSIATIVT